MWLILEVKFLEMSYYYPQDTSVEKAAALKGLDGSDVGDVN
jgi:hypothetical protein